MFSFENADILLCFHFLSIKNDVLSSMKTQTFENVLQSGKLWKRNAIVSNSLGEKNWKKPQKAPPEKKTIIGHVISVPVHLHSKIQDGGGIDREVFVVFPVISLLFCLILNYQFNASLLNNAFYTCAVELGSVFSLVRPQYFHSVSSEMKRWTLGDASLVLT